VAAVPGGYSLNREHVAIGAVNALANLRSEFIARLRAEVASWSYRSDLVGLFGSFARRGGDAHSDIDILVIGEDGLPDDVLDTLASQVLAWTGNRAHVMALSRTDLRRLRAVDDPLVGEWGRDLEVVHGDSSIIGEVAR
jgi:predicted nucleotidyltransferase